MEKKIVVSRHRGNRDYLGVILGYIRLYRGGVM